MLSFLERPVTFNPHQFRDLLDSIAKGQTYSAAATCALWEARKCALADQNGYDQHPKCSECPAARHDQELMMKRVDGVLGDIVFRWTNPLTRISAVSALTSRGEHGKYEVRLSHSGRDESLEGGTPYPSVSFSYADPKMDPIRYA